MTSSFHVRRFTIREAFAASVALFGFFAAVSLSVHAQENVKAKDEKPAVRSAPEMSGYTRPGNPEDTFTAEGDLIRRLNFGPEALKKFKIMGGTVYFAVFKNIYSAEGDTFATGMTNFDTRFEAGRSFKDGMSPRYDKKAKYLYLYQIVNDRNVDPRLSQVKGGKGGGIAWPVDGGKVDPKTEAPVTEDIASFALKLAVDPVYITSWGHFREAGFVSLQQDADNTGKPVREVVDKVERDKILPLAFSHLAPTVMKISNPVYSRRARAHSLGALENGFGVDNSSLNLSASKSFSDLKKVSTDLDKGNIKWLSFVDGLVRGVAAAKEPEYVQIMFAPPEERVAAPIVPPVGAEMLDDEITRVIFRVDWRGANLLKQGSRSVVFGFTSDQPPMSAPIRIDTPQAAIHSQTMRLASYFAEDVVARSTADASGIALTAGGANAGALALALGTSLGIGATPQGAGGEAGVPGFAGITGGFSGIGGSTGGGGGGGLGFPSLAGTFSRPGGGLGSGGGFGGGTGDAGGSTDQGQQGTQNITTNFNASLTNQQQQQQQQGQFQNQNNGRGRGNHDCGQVVPAPASLLLGLLGLPGLWLLRRRKPITEDVAA